MPGQRYVRSIEVADISRHEDHYGTDRPFKGNVSSLRSKRPVQETERFLEVLGFPLSSPPAERAAALGPACLRTNGVTAQRKKPAIVRAEMALPARRFLSLSQPPPPLGRKAPMS